MPNRPEKNTIAQIVPSYTKRTDMASEASACWVHSKVYAHLSADLSGFTVGRYGITSSPGLLRWDKRYEI